MTTTSASVRFSASGVTGVDAFVRLTGQSFIHCCIYDDIAPILALSPQAKGRVERTFQTLQDRLVKALRLAGIDSIAAANAFLPSFIAQYNARFGKPPGESADAHRPLQLSTEQLLFITCTQHTRKLSKSLSCQYSGQQYLIQTGASAGYHLRGAAITVCDDGGEQARKHARNAGTSSPCWLGP